MKYGTFSDDLDQLISRVDDEMEDIRIRLKDKASELTAYHALRHEYETTMDNLSKIIQQFQNQPRQGNIKVNPFSLVGRIHNYSVGFNN